MIIGDFGAYQNRRVRKAQICKRKYRQCVRSQTASGMPVFRARITCTQQLQNCMRGSSRMQTRLRDGLGSALDPAFLMTAGAIQPWRGKDPRYALTNVTRTAYAATHPIAIMP